MQHLMQQGDSQGAKAEGVTATQVRSSVSSQVKHPDGRSLMHNNLVRCVCVCVCGDITAPSHLSSNEVAASRTASMKLCSRLPASTSQRNSAGSRDSNTASITAWEPSRLS